MNTLPNLSIIIPCYNEIENLSNTASEISNYLDYLIKEEKIGSSSFILFVDDGSDDKSCDFLKKITEENKKIKSIRLEKNYGHQIALIAGMDKCVNLVDAMVTIDCDLQQEIFAIERFLQSYADGNQIVLGTRRKSPKEKLFKFLTSKIYQRIISLVGIKYVKGHADFRLVDSLVYKEMQQLIWANHFLRSVFSNTIYKTDIVSHEVSERAIGSTKYSASKMIALAIEGIFTNSLITLRFFGFFGLIVSAFSTFLIVYGILVQIFLKPVEGWASIFVVVCFFGGISVFTFALLSESILRLLKQFLGSHPYKLSSDK